MPQRHLVFSVTLMTAALAATSTLGQQRATLQALAEKVCQFGKRVENDWRLEQLGLNAPLVVVVESTDSGVAVSGSTCSNMPPRTDTPYIAIHHLVEASAPGESVFVDYFTISDSGELLEGIRHNLTENALIRLDITKPEWREQVRDLESYWLNKYGLQSR